MLSSLAVLVSLVASAAAHATFQAMWVNGVDQGSWCVRMPLSNSPVTSVTSNVRIHKGKRFHLINVASLGHCMQCHSSLK